MPKSHEGLIYDEEASAGTKPPTPPPKEQAFYEYDPKSAPQLLQEQNQDALTKKAALVAALQQQSHEYDHKSAPQVDPRDPGPRPVSMNYRSSDKIVGRSNNENAAGAGIGGSGQDNSVRAPWYRRRRWLVLLGLVLFALVALAAILGGVLGSRAARSSRASTSTSNNGSSNSGSSNSTSPSSPSSGSGNSTTTTHPTGNANWAYNGTSLSALTYSTTTDTSGTNYIVFYQHSNGDIRKAVWNNSAWHSSEFVTSDALLGTPLTSYWKSGNYTIELVLFYFDQAKVIQELRGTHGSSKWVNGTVGQLSLTSSETSSLTMVYNGECSVAARNAWLIYHTGANDTAKIVYWDEDQDAWSSNGGEFGQVKADAGFAGESNVGVWRYYYVDSTSSQLTEYVCPDCCGNSSSAGWRQGLAGPVVDNEAGSIAVANVGLPRLVYYLDNDGSVRELNNSLQWPYEVWMEDVASNSSVGNTGVAANSSLSVGPAGTLVFQTDQETSAIPNITTGVHRGVTMAAGFRGTIQQIWLFFQTNGTDVTFQVRDADSAGVWSTPTQIPVGTSSS